MMQRKPTYRRTYPASSLEMKRRGTCGERSLFTDTHCNTEGYPGNFKPLEIPTEKPTKGWGVTLLMTAGVLMFAWCACYLAGCLS